MLYSTCRQRTEAFYEDWAAKELIDYYQNDIEPIVFETITNSTPDADIHAKYLSHLNHNQKGAFERALKKIKQDGFKDALFVIEYCPHHDKKCLFISCSSFSKTDEKLCLEDFKNRNITAPGDIMKVIVGAFYWFLQKLWDAKFPQYCLSANAEELSEKVRDMESHYRNPKWIQLDGSRFDSSQYALYMDTVNCTYYRHALKEIGEHFTRDFLTIEEIELVATNLHRKVFTDIGSYNCYGTTASGFNNTTEGNTFRSMLYMSFLLHKTNGSILEDQTFIVKGDDMLLCIESSDFPSFERRLADYFPTEQVKHGIGIPIKDYTVGDITDIGFCSMKVILGTNGEYKFVREPDRLLAMYGYTAATGSAFSEGTWKTLCASNADSMDSWGKDLPLVRAISEGFRILAGNNWKKRSKVDKFFNKYKEEFRKDERSNKPFIGSYFTLIRKQCDMTVSDVLLWESNHIAECNKVSKNISYLKNQQ